MRFKHRRGVVRFISALGTIAATIGMLAIPGTAHSIPLSPAASDCVQYGWNGHILLRHSNGWTASFNVTGPRATGQNVTARHAGGGTLRGIVNGEIVGRDVRINLSWNNGAIGKYTGTVGDDGIAHGSTVDIMHRNNKATWRTATPISCLKTAPAPKGPLKRIGKAPIALVVTRPVDVYNGVNAPEGAATRTGTLPAGTVVYLTGTCGDTPAQVKGPGRTFVPDKWCPVTGNTVPGGKGFIWGHLRLK